MIRFDSRSVEETEKFASEFAESLRGGEVLLLGGDLGAGKTAFVRGLVRGLQGDENEVSSPTFALMNRYEGRLPVNHFDLYRLSGEEEVYDLGFDEIFRGGREVCAVEWYSVAGEDFWRDLPCIRIELRGQGDERTVTVEE